MKEAVFDTITPAEFEEKWCSFVNTCELEQNDWLSGLYKELHRWARIMLKKHFWAGMPTTQRSVSIHAFFDGYINSTVSLRQFVKQYDNALRSRAEKEFETDFQSMDTTIPFGSNSSIEKQFQEEYTHAKFKEVQAEFKAKMNCVPSLKTLLLTMCWMRCYLEIEQKIVSLKFRLIVTIMMLVVNAHYLSLEVFCVVMCFVCTQERVKNMPLKYVLVRWSKNIKRKHSYIKSSYNVTELKPQMDRFGNLCKHVCEVAEVAAELEDKTMALHETLHEFKSDLLCLGATSNDVNRSSNSDSNPNRITRRDENVITEIRSPLRVTREGRPRSKRKLSFIEKVMQRCRKRTNKRGGQLTTKESNLGRVVNHRENNLCVESFAHDVTGGELLDTSTMDLLQVGGNMPYVDLLTSEIDFSDLRSSAQTDIYTFWILLLAVTSCVKTGLIFW